MFKVIELLGRSAATVLPGGNVCIGDQMDHLKKKLNSFQTAGLCIYTL